MDLPKIPHSPRGMLGRGRHPQRPIMGAMKSIPVPDRSNARVQRLAQVKFIGLPLELPPPSETDRTFPARLLASLRETLSRVIGCLEAARP
jgi:hypothetical protein